MRNLCAIHCKKSGGGVLIVISNEFSHEEVILNDFLHIELLRVLVKFTINHYSFIHSS